MPVASTARLLQFIEKIQDPARGSFPADDVAVVVAHPDDETVACGALLRRLDDVLLIVVTDGAPRNLHDAHVHGFATAEQYAAARSRELFQVITAAGIHRVIQLGVPDQEATFNLKTISSRLLRILHEQHIGVVLTLAYEGGHPDHDSIAFAVHHAVRAAGHTIGLLEMPLYRAGDSCELRQSFVPCDDRKPTTIVLSNDERDWKRYLTGLYSTQKQVLAGFSVETEQFRIAPEYDFANPPNGGHVLYERYDWGIRIDGWQCCVRAILNVEALV